MSSETPVRLYLLQLSASTVHRGGQTLEMVLVCYLVQTSDGKNILIDTGLPPEYASPQNAVSLEPATNVIEQLHALGLQPDDIDILICTHFDVDHAGYHDAFTKAELVVQREHYELARNGHPRFANTRAHWDHPALKYRLLDGDTEIVPGLSVIATGGHAPGHQSVLVCLPDTGPILLAIDAVVMERLFTPDRQAWPMDDDQEQLRASTQKLLALVKDEQVVLTIFGHDGSQWKTLKKAPAYYS